MHLTNISTTALVKDPKSLSLINDDRHMTPAISLFI